MTITAATVSLTGSRNPRAEAQELIGSGHSAMVLEPSPPAVYDGEADADDPLSLDTVRRDRPVISPVGNGDITWDDWVGADASIVPWAEDRWLGPHRRLARPPDEFVTTRQALHLLAIYVVSPARRRVNEKIGLRYTAGGFGTPFFGTDVQVRVVGDTLVLQEGGSAVARPVTSITDAANFVLGGAPDRQWAADLDVPEIGAIDSQLPVDADAAAFLGDWYGFSWSILEELRADKEATDPSRVQLWPEHFDAAFDCLSDDEGRRAGFGASPGDDQVPEPYFYVLPWHFERVSSSEVWNATNIDGAFLALTDVVDAEDQRAAVLDFYRTSLAVLASDRHLTQG